MNGWIKLHNKFLKWGWLAKSEMVSLFIYLLLTANYEDKNWQGIVIKRGQTFVGRKKLSKTLGISQQTIRTCLTRLKATSEITTKTTNKYTVITIVKYNEYQTTQQKTTTKTTKKSTNNQPTTNQQLTTPKEYKNIRSKDLNTLRATPAEGEVIPDLLKNKQKHIQIIGLWARAKKINFTSKAHQQSFIRRNLHAAQNLVPYNINQIIEVMGYLIKNADFKSTLESVGKYIDEDLSKLNNNKIQSL